MASRRRLESLLILGMVAASLRAFAGCSSDNAGPATGGDQDASSDAKVAADVSRPPFGACADAGVPMRSCTAKQCTQLVGEPAACVGEQCVKLKTPECQGLSGAFDDSNAVWIGSLINLSGADTQNGLIRQHSVELAVKEINAAGGLYTANGCGRLPLAYLSCDDANTLTNPDAGPEGGALDRRAAAKHLAEELKVAGIMGAYNSNNTIEVALNVTDPAKTLLFAPTAGASDITTIANATADGARLVWRTVPTDALQAKAIATYGGAVEKELNKQGTPLRAAIVNRGDAFGNGLRDGVKAAIMLNNMSWAQNAAATPSRVLELSYTPATVATQAPGFVTQLTAFQPDIIFWFGLGEFVPNITVPYESSNPTTKPIWISSGSGQRSELIAACATKPTLKARSRGTSPQVTTPLAQDFFNFRYKATYQDAPQLIFGQTQAYDATYLIAYAAQATKPTFAPVSSLEVARNMAKMVGGSMTVDVGPTGLKTALEALRSGQTIDFNGASGPLDFDPAVGEAPGDYAVWCVRTDPNTNAPAYENVTGMIWRYKTNALDGTFACPP